MMNRRGFVHTIKVTILGFFGLKLVGCGDDLQGTTSQLMDDELPDELAIWSYYVPLTSYEPILDDTPDRHEQDRSVDFEKLQAATRRISGSRNDGTDNRTSLMVNDLRNGTEEFIRIRFWHDDPGQGNNAHSLHIFKRHLDVLERGEKLYVATGTYQDHFHIVMIDPTRRG